MVSKWHFASHKFFLYPVLLLLLIHPGVCTREKPIYIITEYMPLGNLLEFLRQADKAELPPVTLIYMASQVAAAMRYLEGKNFIHRCVALFVCLLSQAQCWVSILSTRRSKGIASLLLILYCLLMLRLIIGAIGGRANTVADFSGR